MAVTISPEELSDTVQAALEEYGAPAGLGTMPRGGGSKKQLSQTET